MFPLPSRHNPRLVMITCGAQGDRNYISLILTGLVMYHESIGSTRTDVYSPLCHRYQTDDVHMLTEYHKICLLSLMSLCSIMVVWPRVPAWEGRIIYESINLRSPLPLFLYWWWFTLHMCLECTSIRGLSPTVPAVSLEVGCCEHSPRSQLLSSSARSNKTRSSRIIMRVIIKHTQLMTILYQLQK